MAEAARKPRPVRCIVKLGGAAITNKGELESIDEESLQSACAQLRQAMSDGAAPEKARGMDWSRRPGDPADPVVDAEGFAGMAGLGLDSNFVVVHGAGSFGHFQASRSGVHKGGLHSTLVKAGFVATRISVRCTSKISLSCGYRNFQFHNFFQDFVDVCHASLMQCLNSVLIIYMLQHR
uniref:Isopentenyl phosphate kinase n=1 Tax=Triticum urartu TaxID=4572 RepID=A0A8R7PVA0_TRIUA